MTIEEKIEMLYEKFPDNMEELENEVFEGIFPLIPVLYQVEKGKLSSDVLDKIDFLAMTKINSYKKQIEILKFSNSPILKNFALHDRILLSRFILQGRRIPKSIEWIKKNEKHLEQLRLDLYKHFNIYIDSIMDFIFTPDYISFDDYYYLLELSLKENSKYDSAGTIQSFLIKNKWQELLRYFEKFKNKQIPFIDEVIVFSQNVQDGEIFPQELKEILMQIKNLVYDGYPIGILYRIKELEGKTLSFIFNKLSNEEDIELLFIMLATMHNYHVFGGKKDNIHTLSSENSPVLPEFLALYQSLINKKSPSNKLIENIKKLFFITFSNEYPRVYLEEIIENIEKNDKIIYKSSAYIPYLSVANFLRYGYTLTPNINIDEIIYILHENTDNEFHRNSKEEVDIEGVKKAMVMLNYLPSDYVSISLNISFGFYIKDKEDIDEIRKKSMKEDLYVVSSQIYNLFLSEEEMHIIADYYLNFPNSKNFTEIDKILLSSLLYNYLYFDYAHKRILPYLMEKEEKQNLYK